MTIALLLIVPLIFFLCWLLFTLAVHALPFFAGVSLGLWMHAGGSGVLTALLAGLAAAIGTLIAGQMLFALARSPITRLGVALLFAVPAAFAGYHAVHGVLALGGVPDLWRQFIAGAGALAVGASAWGRLAAFDLAAPAQAAPFGR
ncbi:MAG: hypothetical protein J0I69_05100 [Altererythrobacter sp.]|nr:hypothetical protein [Altererythrobacter sp.]OJU59453.1 MAG: hypothetical protein BGO08_03780 [Altererythrobacter sp. 66-12]